MVVLANTYRGAFEIKFEQDRLRFEHVNRRAADAEEVESTVVDQEQEILRERARAIGRRRRETRCAFLSFWRGAIWDEAPRAGSSSLMDPVAPTSGHARSARAYGMDGKVVRRRYE